MQERIAAYLTDLIGIGFSGFRVDAAKHIRPADLALIFGKVARNLGGSFPDDFATWLEVLLGGESDLLMCDPASAYSYGADFATKLSAAGLSADDVLKVKIWNSGYPKEPEKGSCGIPLHRSAIQNDDADQQNPGSSSRDMQGTGCVLIKDCSSADEHRQFEVELFTSPPGAASNADDYPIRMVLSSFYWYGDGVQGIPDGLSDCKLCTENCNGCKTVPFTAAYSPASIGYDKTGYTRVHRDAAIIKAMQTWMEISSPAETLVTAEE